MSLSPSDDFWLFGYGSLIWKPPPHFDQRIPGYIKGYVRRFWQVSLLAETGRIVLKTSSEDHRGTPEAPGRVVTLIQRSFWETLDDPHRLSEGDRVWGVAYHILPAKAKEVQEYLDIREINGYSIQYTPFHPADASLPDLNCLVYIGMPDNPQFLGALQPHDVAVTINHSVGPSGENREYLLQLEEALKELSADSRDRHISDLAHRVRAMESPFNVATATGASAAPVRVSHALRKVSSTEEQEEIEKESLLN